MPGPKTPIVAVGNCAYRLIEVLNGVYYYETCSCPGEVITGWGVSSENITAFGCNGSLCRTPVTVLPRSEALAMLIETPIPRTIREKQHFLKELKGFAKRITGTAGTVKDAAVHRDIRDVDEPGRNWFDKVLDNVADIDQTHWKMAIREFSVAKLKPKNEGGDNIFRAFDAPVQVRGIVPNEVPAERYNEEPSAAPYKQHLVVLDSPKGNAADSEKRVFALYEKTLTSGQVLRFGQEVEDRAIPASANVRLAKMADRHRFCHVIQYNDDAAGGEGLVEFLVTGFREFVARAPFV